MAHENQILFCRSVKRKFPNLFIRRFVLDVGSLDINGNNQYLFDDCLYIGADLMPGKNVDVITPAHEISLPNNTFDTIISTECFEHDRYYDKTLKNIVRLLKPGGLLVFSCATTGRPEHGTTRTTPADAPFLQYMPDWANYYKNLTESDIRAVLDIENNFSIFEFSINDETKDLYFFGVKSGVFEERDDYSFSICKNRLNPQIEHLRKSLALSGQKIERLTLQLEEQSLRRVMPNDKENGSEQLDIDDDVLTYYSGVLVSSPGEDGGLFLVNEEDVTTLDRFGTAGICATSDGFLRAKQPYSLFISNQKSTEFADESLDDIHDVLYFEGCIYVVGTIKNQIAKFDSHGNELHRWVFSGEDDSRHINCLGVWNGRVVFSAFGDFAETRGYKSKTSGAGYVQELVSGRRLIVGLNQPHSLVSIGQNLLVANSGEQEIREYSPSGDLVRCKKLDAYVRGISVESTKIFLGLSRSRGVAAEAIERATVVELDSESWEEIRRIQLPSNEIYCIQVINDRRQLSKIISAVANDSIEIYSSEVKDLRRWLKERDEHFAALIRAVREQSEDLCRKNFDADWYLDQYPSVRENGISGEDHYFLHGGAEDGRLPSSDPYIFLRNILTAQNTIFNGQLSKVLTDLDEAQKNSIERERGDSRKFAKLEVEKSSLKEAHLRELKRSEDGYRQKLAQLRQQLEANLRAQVEREKVISERLLDIQKRHTHQLSEKSSRQSEYERALSEQLAAKQEELRELIHQLATSEQRHAQDLHQLNRKFLDGEKARSELVVVLQRTHAKQLSELSFRHAEREEAHLNQAAKLRGKIETHLHAEIEREKAFSQNLQELQQKHAEKLSDKGFQHAEHERSLCEQLIAKQEELDEVTHHLLVSEKNHAEALRHMNSQLIDVWMTRSWRWTAPLRRLALIFGRTHSNFDEKSYTVKHRGSPDYEFINSDVSDSGSDSLTLQIQKEASNREVNMHSNRSHNNAASLDELLSYHDEEFIHCAYHTLLNRAPDTDGLQYYRARIRRGIPKIEIIAQLRLSCEGKSKEKSLPDFDKKIRQYQRHKLPFLGALLRIGSDDSRQTLRAIENKLHVLEEQAQSYLSEISRCLDVNPELHTLISQATELEKPEPFVAALKFDMRPSCGSPIVILTVPHCLYVAHEIAASLAQAKIESKVIFERPANGYDDVPHIVICPQIYDQLPGYYVAFQMEQSVSSRWFTKDYFRTLENSFAILDYSINNIEFLQENGLSRRQINYLPIGYIPNYKPEFDNIEADYDVLFYGDTNNDRRRKFIEEISKHCKVKVINNLFGEELHAEMARARIIVNIHYYVGALLETTRIWECLSLNKLVISERSTDMEHQSELNNVIDFVDIDDISAMISRIKYWLENDDLRREKTASNRHLLEQKPSRFEYFFHRFLLATDNIAFDEFWNLAGKKLKLTSEKICLSLPEDVVRVADFNKDNQYGFSVFPGLRHSQGWLGCAMSYKFMIMLARQQGLRQVAICEDDVEFPKDFSTQWEDISAHLAKDNSDWDIFSGLLANLSKQAKILNAYKSNNRQFAVVDKLISTVFNVYNYRVYDVIANWDTTNHDVHTNTIDRYLERHASLKVLTTSPFMVDHKEEQQSTIWGFQNTQYKDLILESRKLLNEKIGVYYQEQKKFRLRDNYRKLISWLPLRARTT